MENLDKIIEVIAGSDEHTLEVALFFHPIAKHWVARIRGTAFDPIEVKGKTAEIALRCLMDQIAAR